MLLTAIFSALLFFVPLIYLNVNDDVMRFTIFGIKNPIEMISLSTTYTWPLVVLTALMTILPLYTIFIYKKRELQVRLCRLIILLNALFLGLVYIYYESDILSVILEAEHEVQTLDMAYCIGMAFPLVNLVLEFFAIRGIKKDIELLKSVDRLR